jgi:hypothetical protein
MTRTSAATCPALGCLPEAASRLEPNRVRVVEGEGASELSSYARRGQRRGGRLLVQGRTGGRRLEGEGRATTGLVTWI